MASQMQRAAVSIPANIAEGYGRLHRGDYVRHLSIACGSLGELETHITIAVRLDFIQHEDAMPLWNIGQHVGQMFTILFQSLKRQEKPPQSLVAYRPIGPIKNKKFHAAFPMSCWVEAANKALSEAVNS